jgi:D-lactate dehydrogenase
MCLFSPNTDALTPLFSHPTPDRAPEHLAGGTPLPLRNDLIALLGRTAVRSRVSDLIKYATDASPYRLFPQVVIVAESVEQIAKTLAYAKQNHRSVTFRAGGSSLNGQSQGDDILIDVRNCFKGMEILENGIYARIKPGITISAANHALLAYGRVLGPDPASGVVATIGGVVANNASGMTAGTKLNSYHTVASMRILLPSGTLINTADKDVDRMLAEHERELHDGLLDVREGIVRDEPFAAWLKKKFSIKNTNGYRLDAFLDCASPGAIIQKLMVGSEGTLGFIAEVTFETLPLKPLRSTGLLIFSTLHDAAAAAPRFIEIGAMAAELMDGRCLHLATSIPGVPKSWGAVNEDAGSLLVEFRAAGVDELSQMEEEGLKFASSLKLHEPAQFSRDTKAAAILWKVREGLYPIVAAGRAQGTCLMIEDICVPQSQVGDAANDIIELQKKFHYLVNIAGHASAGNLHFLVGVNFGVQSEVDKYASFMEEMTSLIVNKYDGSLKAEHGTGRNIAPFLEKEWGPKATAIMWRIKQLFDPKGLLAPGVMLNKDPLGHVKNTHTCPEIEHVANACIECGYCEPVCPSRNLTTTPRQRITLRREMMRHEPGSPIQKALLKEYEYDAIQTCAGDSSCALACPVGINTRTIIPIIQLPDPAPGVDGATGLGDIQESLFLSPAKVGPVIWGAGPVISFPTATEHLLGTGKLSVGPTAVALTIQGHSLFGVLAQNLFSVAGPSGRSDVDQMLIQPFVNYNLPHGWYLTSSPVITANWETRSRERWTVPVGGGVGKIVHFGKLPMNMYLQCFRNVEHPDGTTPWALRFQIQFLFPKK